MENIYLVSSGSYSDYRIDGAFSTEEKAAAFVEMMGNKFSVEMYAVDKLVPHIREGLHPFSLWMYANGDTDFIQALDSDELDNTLRSKTRVCVFDNAGKIAMETYMFAEDEEHAVKIANERRVQLIAAGQFVDGYKGEP